MDRVAYNWAELAFTLIALIVVDIDIFVRGTALVKRLFLTTAPLRFAAS